MLTIPNPTALDMDPALQLLSFGTPTTAMTFEMLFAMPAATGASSVAIAQIGASATAATGFGIATWSDYLDVWIGGARFDTTIPVASLIGATPHRITVSWDSATGEARAYLDGAAKGSAIVAQGKVLAADQPLVLGAGSGNDLTPNYSYGDVRVFDHVRTPQEIADFSQTALPDPASVPGLVGYWTEAGGTLVSQVAGVGDIVLDEDVANYTRTARPVTIDTGNTEVDALVDGLLMTSAYSAGTALTYTFDRSSSLSTTDGLNWQALNPSMEAEAREYLSDFTALTGVQGVEVDEKDQNANFYFASRDSVASAYVVGHEGGILHVFNNSSSNPLPGNYTDHLLVHEIGHALGLAHGHDADALPSQYQGFDWSVMSYREHPESVSLGFDTNHGPETWMLADIATIQYQFGANFTTHAENTTYRWDPTTGETFINNVGQGAGNNNHIYRTIWDGNGTDTYDLSNYHSNLEIDLTPGRFSTFADAQISQTGHDAAGNALYAGGNVANAYMYYGDSRTGDTRSLIENAVGGRGDDTIAGNQANNELQGGGGKDHLIGGDGNDRLIGDAGHASTTGATHGLGLNLGGATGQSIRLTGANGLAQTAITLEFAIKFDAVPGGQWFFSVPGLSLLLDPSNTGAPGLWVQVNGNWTYSGISVAKLGDGVAHQISFTWDGATGKFAHYLDGVGIKSGTGFNVGGLLTATGTGNIVVNPVGGAVGDVRIYDRALDAEEIYGSTGSALPDPAATSGLVLNWQVNADGSVTDATGGTNPTVAGTPSPVTLIAAASDDDVLDGGNGNDLLIGGAGADRMTGGAGSDHYFVDNSGDIVIETAGTAQGSDSIYYTGANYTLADNVGIETVWFQTGAGAFTGNNLAQNFAGNDLANIIHGGGGNDAMSGNGGTDTLYGDTGNDALVGGAGDILRGGADNDSYYIDEAGVIVEEIAGEGYDAVIVRTAHYVMTADMNVETVTLSTGAISVTGNDENNIVAGNALDNTLLGGRGADRLSGGLGNDVLDGGDGNDLLIGDGGADRMSGGAGSDHYFVDNTGDVVVEAAGAANGLDSIYFSGASYILSDDVGIEYVWFKAGAGAFTGNNLAQNFAGNDLANVINGGGGNDAMSGNGGADRLIGGAGADIVFGNAGADRFAFTSWTEGGAGERIGDFSSVQGDKIELSAAGFLGIEVLHLASGSDVSTAVYGTTSGAFFFDTAGSGLSNLYFDADGDGAGAATLLAQVSGATALGLSDLILV